MPRGADQRAIEDEPLLERIHEVHERNYCACGHRRMSIALAANASVPAPPPT